jgi:hypothetical protein
MATIRNDKRQDLHDKVPLMSITLACPSCGATIKAPDKSAGRRAACPGCGVLITVPSSAPSAILTAAQPVPPGGRPEVLPPRLLHNNRNVKSVGTGATAALAMAALVAGLTLGAVGGFQIGHKLGSAEHGQALAEATAVEALRAELPERNESGKKTAKANEAKQVPIAVSKSDQSKGEPPPAALPLEKLTKAGTGTAPANTPDDRDRAALFEFVKKHAQKPANLEIVELGAPVKGQAGAYSRSMVIRCELIDYTPDVENFTRSGETGQRKLDPKPLSRDSGTAYYTPNGKVGRVHLDGCSRWW